MINAVKSGEILKVIVYRIDRISRNIVNFADLVSTFEKYKVDFVSTNEKFDMTSPMGRGMVYIAMVFAQIEREYIVERVTDNYYERGKSGVWLGGPAPLGYTIQRITHNGKKVSTIIENEDIEKVDFIFSAYANTNNSLGGIAKQMKEKYGGMWNNIKLARILHNPAYVKADADVYHFYQKSGVILINEIDEFTGELGCNLYGKRDRAMSKYNNLEDQVLALSLHKGRIDSKTWLRCQYKMENNVQIKNTGKGKHSWLTGLIKCGYCGYGMRASINRGSRYFVCTGRYASDLCKKVLSVHYINEIENIVEERILSRVQLLNGVKISTSVNDRRSNNFKIKLHNVETEISKLISSLDNANSVLMKYINEKIIELDNQKMNLLTEINKCAVEPRGIEIPDMAGWPNGDLEHKHNIAQTLISRVVIYDNEIDIEWKFDFESVVQT